MPRGRSAASAAHVATAAQCSDDRLLHSIILATSRSIRAFRPGRCTLQKIGKLRNGGIIVIFMRQFIGFLS